MVVVDVRSNFLMSDKEECRWCGGWRSILSWVGEGFFYITLFVVYMAGCLMEGNQGHGKPKLGAD